MIKTEELYILEQILENNNHLRIEKIFNKTYLKKYKSIFIYKSASM